MQTGNFGIKIRLTQREKMREILSMAQQLYDYYMSFFLYIKIGKNAYMSRTIYFNFLQSR